MAKFWSAHKIAQSFAARGVLCGLKLLPPRPVQSRVEVGRLLPSLKVSRGSVRSLRA